MSSEYSSPVSPAPTSEPSSPVSEQSSGQSSLPADLPACVTEDSTDCTWDASTQGNGKGLSFVTRGPSEVASTATDSTFESCSVGVYVDNVSADYGSQWANYCGQDWGATCWVYPGEEETDHWTCSLDWLGKEGYTPDNPSVPPCTDAIADAGGICWGEPVSEGPPATTTATLAETGGGAEWITPDVGIGIGVIIVVGIVLARKGWARG